ncbi:unnamed protein product [Protopolystoma xenopodis]|uniref:Uncharacterized protein n=1 Tax=Protopolystoma xenopodis TaxID=117903 RepID=A0A3S5A2T5_9PLAT|nr:unnamed protein product [Protopolystoma xenopodis]
MTYPTTHPSALLLEEHPLLYFVAHSSAVSGLNTRTVIDQVGKVGKEAVLSHTSIWLIETMSRAALGRSALNVRLSEVEMWPGLGLTSPSSRTQPRGLAASKQPYIQTGRQIGIQTDE